MNDNKALERAEIVAALREKARLHPDVWLYRDAAGLLEQLITENKVLQRDFAAARAKAQPPNKPLTLDELRSMDGEPVYIQYIGACKGFYDDEAAAVCPEIQRYA